MAEHEYRIPMANTCEDGTGTILATMLVREPEKLPQRVGPIRMGKKLPEDIPSKLSELVRLLPTKLRRHVGAIALHRLCERQIHNNMTVIESLGIVAFVGEQALRLPYRSSKEKIVNGFGKAFADLPGTGAIWPAIYPQLGQWESSRYPYSQVVQASAAPAENGLWIVLSGAPSETSMLPLPIMSEEV